jgi:hypothetical protein
LVIVVLGVYPRPLQSMLKGVPVAIAPVLQH